jgi:hypothetical protein
MAYEKAITLENLIKALQILNKYGNPSYPTNCEHAEFRVYKIDPSKVSKEDLEELESYDFIAEEANECFISFEYGSC